ncbi:gp67 [Bacillus phage G]|uniref:Gp67 n=1 Tax=Bacillus phage G TaxID=2884420 RepID=G3MBD7_9CAUD|nr:gp67 [Bacillus phage G]AEO93338.1 gp67 [Bacillus phage G]
MTTKVHIDKIEDDSIWVTGTAEHHKSTYDWYAKVDDEKNKNGLDKGRVIKLVVRKGNMEEDMNEDEFWEGVVANYDRSWIIKPKDSASTEIFYTILDELEQLEVYKKRIYGGSTIKKIVEKTKNTFSLGT